MCYGGTTPALSREEQMRLNGGKVQEENNLGLASGAGFTSGIFKSLDPTKAGAIDMIEDEARMAGNHKPGISMPTLGSLIGISQPGTRPGTGLPMTKGVNSAMTAKLKLPGKPPKIGGY